MEVRNYNTLTFLRHYFHIPASQKIAWALIVETIAGREEIRLGVLFSRHPYLYLDVAMRRFFTESTLFNGAASRRVFPAQRLMSKDGFVFVTENGLSRTFHKGYIRDIYHTSVYSPELFSEILL